MTSWIYNQIDIYSHLVYYNIFISLFLQPSSPEMKTDESDGEYTFVRETSSPEIEVPQTRLQIPSPPIEEEDEKSDDENAEVRSYS